MKSTLCNSRLIFTLMRKTIREISRRNKKCQSRSFFSINAPLNIAKIISDNSNLLCSNYSLLRLHSKIRN